MIMAWVVIFWQPDLINWDSDSKLKTQNIFEHKAAYFEMSRKNAETLLFLDKTPIHTVKNPKRGFKTPAFSSLFLFSCSIFFLLRWNEEKN